MKANVLLSEIARALAEKRVREEGFESIDSYVDALIEQDNDANLITGLVRMRLREGLASPNAGELTREKFDLLVKEGIARTTRRE
jgi:hypothetical protein